jgi:Uma2 family endonuclease
MKPPDLDPKPEGSRDEALPLEPGDRLSRDEFERRYEAMPELKKAELIEGVVYMPSPVRVRRHGRPNRHLSAWLGVYEAATPSTLGADNCTVRLDLTNEPQPDALLLIEPEHGGQAQVSDDDYVEDAPELVAEVAASSASYDLHTKLEVYQRNGVREYIVWRVRDRQIDWFVLRQAGYERLTPSPDRLLRSEVFPGLWLDLEALVRGDLARVLDVVRQGIATPEHAAFVAGLNAPSRRGSS